MHDRIGLLFRIKNQKQFKLVFQSAQDRERFVLHLPPKCLMKITDFKSKLEESTSLWIEEKISNFEYLACVNKLSSRNVLTLSQQPIFPWVTLSFETNFQAN